MALPPGTRIGVYDITAPIGEGGMGQVYRATDTKLKRQVAIKILPPAFAADADRLARFQREAELLASLNHPNIAAIHGLEEGTGVSALVMELVEGDDLSQRIARGAIPIEEALPIAKQIAEALEAAHEQGIIHRDLKPANIKVRADGTVKVLDFGLAKAFDTNASGATANAMNSLTITSPAMTQAGMILGTAAYMSPEQARGRAVDRRADIWAFGAVLFEMLTGTRAFAGDNITDTLAAVVSAEPDWRLLPASLPPAVGSWVRRCLHKDLRQRVQAIGDVRLALEGAFETIAPQAAVHLPQPAWRRALPLVTLLVGAVLSVVAAWSVWPGAQSRPVNRSVHILPDDVAYRDAGKPVIALSPDGRSIAYNTSKGLYLRPMDELEGHLITGEYGVSSPFFSPDGRSIGYFAGELKRISVTGGAPSVVSRTTSNPFGATWTTDHTILFGQAQGVFRVSADGGTPKLVIPALPGERIFGPQLLPDGDSVLVTVTNGTWDEGRIVVASLSTGERKVVLEGGSDARFVPTGHLIYALRDALLAVAFDPDRRVVSGRRVPVLQGLMRAAGGSLATGTANYDVAKEGTLVYVAGRSFMPRTLVWLDRNGNKVADTGVRGVQLVHPEVSPDGASVAYAAAGSAGVGDLGVWSQSFASGASTLLGPGYRPVWAPDGSAVAFNSGLNADVIVRPVDGIEPAEPIVATPADENVGDWSSDGKYLFFDRRDSATNWDLWYLERDETGNRWASEAQVFLKEPDSQFVPKISPNGRYVAFGSNQSGRTEVYVRPFPHGGRQWTVSNHGGTRHRWSRAGNELFYLEGDTLMAVTVSTEGEFSHGVPQPLFPNKGLVIGLTDMATYDVSRDGQRFLVVAEADAATGAAQAGRIIIVQNWLEELKRLLPVGR